MSNKSGDEALRHPIVVVTEVACLRPTTIGWNKEYGVSSRMGSLTGRIGRKGHTYAGIPTNKEHEAYRQGLKQEMSAENGVFLGHCVCVLVSGGRVPHPGGKRRVG